MKPKPFSWVQRQRKFSVRGKGREVRAGSAGRLHAGEAEPVLTYGHGHHIRAQEDLQPPHRLVSNLDLHENPRVRPGFLGRRLTLSRKRKQ